MTALTIESTGVEGDERWAELWTEAERAGDAAIAPLEGSPCRAFAFSHLIIRPATSGFARYLRRHRIGHRGAHGGWDVGWVLGDAEVCRAYNDAVRQVLVYAGIEVESHWQLDTD